MKVEWSRPRATPMAGHRKATLKYCDLCTAFHRTHRHAQGEEICPIEQPEKPEVEFPHLRLIPRTASR